LLSSLPKPDLYSRPGGVLSLSGPALQELLRAVLDRGIPFRLTALGFSMHPFIRDGDILTVSPKPETRLGDVVAFCHPDTGKLVVHRVLGRAPGGYLLRGDNAPEVDGLIPPEKILGLVTGVERKGRKVRLGRGPERRLLAWLARRDLLRPLIFRAWQVLHAFGWRSPA
jgi:signal peptidase